jgi:hypothetical protein
MPAPAGEAARDPADGPSALRLRASPYPGPVLQSGFEWIVEDISQCVRVILLVANNPVETLLLPEWRGLPKDRESTFAGVRLPRMQHPRQVGSAKQMHDDVYVVRHQSVGFEAIPPSIVMMEILDDDPRDLGVTQMTTSPAFIETDVESSRKDSVDLIALHCRWFIVSCDESLDRLSLLKKLLIEVLRQRVGQPVGDRIDRVVELPVRKVSAMTDLEGAVFL